MGEIVSKLAFPVPEKQWSEALLLERERLNQLVFLTTKSGLRYAFGDCMIFVSYGSINPNEDRKIPFLIFSFCRTLESPPFTFKVTKENLPSSTLMETQKTWVYHFLTWIVWADVAIVMFWPTNIVATVFPRENHPKRIATNASMQHTSTSPKEVLLTRPILFFLEDH